MSSATKSISFYSAEIGDSDHESSVKWTNLGQILKTEKYQF